VALGPTGERGFQGNLPGDPTDGEIPNDAPTILSRGLDVATDEAKLRVMLLKVITSYPSYSW